MGRHSAFPFALPEVLPGVRDKELVDAWRDLWPRLKARMGKLRKAAEMLSAYDEDRVAWAIYKVFSDADGNMLRDEEKNQYVLDMITPMEIVHSIRGAIKHCYWEPFVRFDNPIPLFNCMFVANREWEIGRVVGFGGSETSVPMHVEKYESQSARHLVLSKRKLPAPVTAPDKAFIFAYGHTIESLVIKTFTRLTGGKQLCCPFMYRHRDYEFMTANPDAIIELPDGELVVFEAKSTSSNNEDDWKRGIPQQYLFQPPQYLAVLDDPRIKRAFIGCVISNHLSDGWYCWPINRDREVENSLIEAERALWEGYVLTGELPEYSGDPEKDASCFFEYERTPDILASSKFEEMTVESLPDFQAWMDLDAKKREASASLKAIEEQQKLLAKELFAQLADDAAGGRLVEPDTGMMYVLSCQSRTTTKVNRDLLQQLYPGVWSRVAAESTSYNDPSVKYRRVPKAKPGKKEKGA